MLLPAAASAQADLALPQVASVERREISGEVSGDGNYTVTEKVYLSLRNTGDKFVMRVPCETHDCDIVEAGEQSGAARELPLSVVRKPHAGGPDEFEIPFSRLKPDALVWYELRRSSRNAGSGKLLPLFSMDVIYGFLRLEKAGHLRLVSDKPLFYEAHDPGHVLKVEQHPLGKRYEIRIELTQPVQSASEASLDLMNEADLLNETTRVQISSSRDWKAFEKAAAEEFRVDGPLPTVFEQEVHDLQAIADTRSRIEHLFSWLAENLTFVGPGGLHTAPRPLSQIASDMRGDDKDVALVTLAILKSLGISAEPVFMGAASMRDRACVFHTPVLQTSALPAFSYFTQAAVRVNVNDQWTTVDPTRGLADVSRPPYYFLKQWKLTLGPHYEPMSRLEIQDPAYGKVLIHGEITPKKGSGYTVRERVGLQGEWANILKFVYLQRGEADFSKYMEALTGVDHLSGFTYQKVDFVDRRAGPLNVELVYDVASTVSLKPPYLPAFSRPSEGVYFPKFPMQAHETVVADDAFIDHEELYDCTVRGPRADIDRRIENREKFSLIRSHVEIPVESVSESDAALSLHIKQLSACMDDSEMALHKPGASEQPSVDSGTVAGSSLSVELRKLDAYLKTNPNDDSAWRTRGRILRQMGHVGGEVYIDGFLAEAEKSFKKAVELNPKESANYGQLGINYLFRGNLTKSLETFMRSVALDHRSFEALQLGGLISKRTGKNELAVSYFASAAARAAGSEDKAWALTEEADLMCEQLHRCKDALKVEDKLVAIQPPAPWRLHNAALAYAQQSLWDKAISLERDAMKTGDFPEAKLELLKDLLSASEARIATGSSDQIQAAAGLLNEALKLDPRNKRTLSLLNMATKFKRVPANQ